MEPVVITGMGVLACNGLGREAFWNAIKEGRTGIRRLDRFDASDLPCQIGGQLWDFNPEDFMRKSVVKHWHRHVHQAVASARLAVQDAGLASAGYAPERMSAAVGTSVGSPDEAYESHKEAYRTGGFKRVSKYASSAFSSHSATVHVSIDFGLKGPAITIASGCATGLDVLAWGVSQIQQGRADAVVAGATESPIFSAAMISACSLGILSKRNDEPGKAMRPFDKHRDGIVLSEGACTVVLERADKARARGARILGEVAGTGSSAEALNPLILDSEGKGLARAVHAALEDAGLTAQEVDSIFAHGVSLEMYDRSETNAYKLSLGREAYRIPISAVKSMIGQSYAAGGMMNVAAALLALNEGVLAPTVNLENPDPSCDLDYVPNTARVNDIQTALATAISFGGTHSAVLLRRAA